MADRWSLPSGSVGQQRFRVWPAGGDSYDHTELTANWDHIDGIVGSPPSGQWPPTEGINGGIYALIKAIQDRLDDLEEDPVEDDPPVLVIDDKYIIGYGTTFPASPPDGKHFVLVDHLTNPTWQWHCRYVAAATTYKWVFVGGTPMVTTNAAQTTIGGGLSLSLPKSGQYFAQGGAVVSWHVAALQQAHLYVSAGIGSGTAQSLVTTSPLNSAISGDATVVTPVASGTGTTAVLDSSTTGDSGGNYRRISDRWLKVWPKRLAP